MLVMGDPWQVYGSEELIKNVTTGTIVSGVLLLGLGLALVIHVVLHNKRKRKNSEVVRLPSIMSEVSMIG